MAAASRVCEKDVPFLLGVGSAHPKQPEPPSPVLLLANYVAHSPSLATSSAHSPSIRDPYTKRCRFRTKLASRAA
jgi:hypothetical protein